MDRPIIPDDVDLVYLALVGLVDLTEQVTNASASNDMISQLQDPSGAGIEGSDHAPLLGRRALPIRQGNGSGRLFRSEGHTAELHSLFKLVCPLPLDQSNPKSTRLNSTHT